jgi:hypothetical protein
MKHPAHIQAVVRIIFRRSIPILLLLAIAGLSGCVDLAAIREFTNRAPSPAAYDDLASHYIGQFDRLKRYRDPSRWPDLERRATQREQQEPALLGLHRGTIEYLNALGALASDELVSYDMALDGLTVAIKEAGMVSDSQADAFASLSGFIAKAATDGYRRRKLQQFITEGNESFQKVAAALTNIVGRDFVRELDSEISEVDSYYEEVIADAGETGSQQAAIELLKDQQTEKLSELRQRKEACLAYAATLHVIAQAHQVLFERRDQLASRDTLQMLYGYGQDVKALRAKLKTLQSE